MLKQFAALALAVLPFAAQAQSPQVLKVSTAVAPNPEDPIYAWMLAFEKGVEEASKGAIDVQLYPSSQLGQQLAALEGLSMGTIEAASAVIGLFGGTDPRFQVLDAGALFDGPEHAFRALNTPEVREMLGQFGTTAGIEVLSVMIDGQGVIVSKKPISSVDDFKGMKIRAGGAGPLLTEPLKALGASPVTLPLGEVLPALQTGTVDAATSSVAVVNTFNMVEVAPNVSYIPGNMATVGIAASRSFMDTIGPDLAKIVRDEAREAAETVETAHLKEIPQAEATVASKGGTLIRFGDAEAKAYLDTVRPVIEKVIAQDSQRQADYEVLRKAAEATR